MVLGEHLVYMAVILEMLMRLRFLILNRILSN